MEIEASEKFKKDIAFFKKNTPQLAKKVKALIEDIMEGPFEGIGRPEQLKANLSGWWSRRIDQKNRLIYKYEEINDLLTLLSCRGHYENLDKYV